MLLPIFHTCLLGFLALAGSSNNDQACSIVPRLYANPDVYDYQASNVEGQAKARHRLAGIFPIHEKDCRTVLATKNYNGFQRAEAMTFALDYVNEQVRAGRKEVALDGYILDSCSNGNSAIDATLRMMRQVAPIAGMVGGSYSTVTLALSPILQTYNVTMLSYASTSADLSDKAMHPLFARPIPSDDGQARVVYDLANHLGWKTVEMLTVAGNAYSKSLKLVFDGIAEESKDIFVCETHELSSASKDSEGFPDILKLMRKIMISQADGVIVFVTADFKKPIAEAIGEILKNSTSHQNFSSFRFIATDSWDITDINNTRAEEFLAKKSYVVIPTSAGINSIYKETNITKHFEELTPKTSRNPWTKKVWRSIFGCKTDPECENKRLDWDKFAVDSKVDFVFDSVLIFSDALEKCLKSQCKVNSDDFFRRFILKSNATGELNCVGDGRGTYGVYRLEGGKGDGGAYKYQKIGNWSELNGEEKLILAVSTSRDGENRKTKCRPQCDKGYAEEYLEGQSRCCYNCTMLAPRYYRTFSGGRQKCDKGFWPDESANFSSCFKLTPDSLSSSNSWSIFAISMAWIGIALGFGFLSFTLYYYNHVVIKNCSRELSAFTWLGIMISHINTLLVFYSKPDLSKCALIRFTMTIGYTFILSSLFLKTNRLFRIFYAQFQQSPGLFSTLRFTSPKHQVFLCSGLVLIQVITVAIWIAVDRPENRMLYPLERQVEVCKLEPMQLLMAQTFNIVLCIVTTAYSFLTRRVPENFNESRFINLCMYSICVAWIVESIGWVFRNDFKLDDNDLVPERNWAISTLANSVVASLVLIFLFTHRVYKIMWEKPERGIRRRSAANNPNELDQRRLRTASVIIIAYETGIVCLNGRRRSRLHWVFLSAGTAGLS